MSNGLGRVFFDEPNWNWESFRPKLDLQGEQAAGAAAASLPPSDNLALLNKFDKVIKDFAQNLYFLLGPLSDQLDPVIVDTSGNKDVINWVNTFKALFIDEQIPFVQDILRLVPPSYETVLITPYPPGSVMSQSDSFVVLKRLRSNIFDLVNNYDTILQIPTLLADDLSTAKDSHHISLIVAAKLVSVFQSPEFQAVDHIMDLSRAFETCWPPSLPQIYNEKMRRLVFTLEGDYFKMPGKNNERLEFLGDTILNTAAWFFVRQCKLSRVCHRYKSLRSALSCNQTIAEWSIEYQLPERTGGYVVGKRVADLFEAYVGGLFLDQGMAVVQKWLYKVFSGWLGEGIEITLQKVAEKRRMIKQQEMMVRKRWIMERQQWEYIRSDEVRSATRWRPVRRVPKVPRGRDTRRNDEVTYATGVRRVPKVPRDRDTRAAVRLADIACRKRVRASRKIYNANPV